jgi:hypothetical protein
MKKLRVEAAVGHTLCHDMTAIMEGGLKGVAFKRGHVITQGDIPVLLDMGKSHIFVWEPEADEVHEDDAAVALTKAICGENVEYSAPSEGKTKISSTVKGLFCVNSQALKLINRVEDYTVACRNNYTQVAKDETVAGARIVPLVTKRKNVEKAVAIAEDNYPVFRVLPYKPLRTGIIITGSEIYYGRIKDAFEPILTAKLSCFGADILGFTKCPDDLDMIVSAAECFINKGAELILFTGGMSVDPDDLTPTAIRKIADRILAQGIPMQPGNMLNLAYSGKTALIGVPGASMHFPTTSLDVFLPRIFAGTEITRDEIADSGEGGLCLGCRVCHYPVCHFGKGGR